MELIRSKSNCRWYDSSGKFASSIIGKNGKERNVTVRDARSLKLLPSVTSILSIISKPYLESWKIEQAILQSLTLPKNENESAQDFAKRIVEELDKDRDATLSKGTRIHAAIEAFLNKEDYSIDEDIKENSIEAYKFLEDNVFDGTSEQVLVNDLFAGTCDFVGSTKDYERIIVDFKTQTIKEDGVKFYDEWKMQLAAYKHIICGDYVCANVVIGSNKNHVEMKVWEKEDMEWGLKCFLDATKLFYSLKKL